MHFFDRYGSYTGSFYPYEYLSNGCTILQQALHYQDEGKRLALAQKFIDGASGNMKSVLQYYVRREKVPTEKIEHLGNLQKKIITATTIEELMAIEGNIRELYYSCLTLS